MINKIVLVGNGFDLAHGLKTSYKDFIEWYWEQIRQKLLYNLDTKSFNIPGILDISSKREQLGYAFQDNYIDYLYEIRKNKGIDFFKMRDYLNKNTKVKIELYKFFSYIMSDIENKGWVDIENEYYSILRDIALKRITYSLKDLNEGLDTIKFSLIEYIKKIGNNDIKHKEEFKDIFFSNVSPKDIATQSSKTWKKIIHERFELGKEGRKQTIKKYGYSDSEIEEREDIEKSTCNDGSLFADNILVLNFNYTNICQYYLNGSKFDIINIHGCLNKPDSVIFGYGDEIDKDYKTIENLNDNEFLKNNKSTNYMKSSCYHKLMEFLNLAPYQVIIMGHSCGNSDRTLLHALFEHENCISIKPYYYKDKDGNEHYTDMVQNIYRNFTNKADFRDKVVNIEYCEPMPQV